MGLKEKIEIKAKDLLYELDLKGELAKIKLSHLSLNSKDVLPKSIFFALKGHNFNGNDFNEEARSMSLLIKPNITYNFTRWVNGNLFFEYGINENKTTGKTTNKDFGFRVNIRIQG